MVPKAGARPGQSLSPVGSAMWVAGTQVVGLFSAVLPDAFSRKLDWKQTKTSGAHGMLAPEAVLTSSWL